MDWADERYVRVYTRDTAEWLALSWQARGLFCLLLRTCDRAGIVDLGRIGTKGLAALVHAPWKEIKDPLAELLEDGCVELHSTKPSRSVLVSPNFVEAQESTATSTQRSRESRQRRKDMARAEKWARDETLHDDGTKRCTTGDETSPNATLGDAAGRAATPSVPCRAVPSVPSVPDPPCGPPEGTPPKKAKRTRKKPTVPMPADWQPNDADRARAAKLSLDMETEERKFRTWTQAKGFLYVDWHAGFRSHLESEAKKSNGQLNLGRSTRAGDLVEGQIERAKRLRREEDEEAARR